MSKLDIEDIERRMEASLSSLQTEFMGLRAGRANPAMLETLLVDAYGSKMPLNQVGNVSAPESRLLTVSVWDTTMVPIVEKAIREAGLGLNPMADGQMVRVPLPELNEERREELVKIAGKYSEQCRVAVRNVRRDGMDQLKKGEKDGEISQDEQKSLSEDVQKLTDDYVEKIDQALSQKEAEIRQV